MNVFLGQMLPPTRYVHKKLHKKGTLHSGGKKQEASKNYTSE